MHKAGYGHYSSSLSRNFNHGVGMGLDKVLICMFLAGCFIGIGYAIGFFSASAECGQCDDTE